MKQGRIIQKILKMLRIKNQTLQFKQAISIKLNLTQNQAPFQQKVTNLVKENYSKKELKQNHLKSLETQIQKLKITKN